MKIALIACCKSKAAHRCPARDLYISPLFKGSYAFAKKLCADKIFILSAKHCLVAEDEELEPYNTTLNNMKVEDIKYWAEEVKRALREKTDVENDEFIILAGEKYRKYIVDILKHKSVPLQGMGIGKQLSYLKKYN